MSSYAEHISKLSHVGGLPRTARQTVDAPAELRQKIEKLTKIRASLMAEAEGMRRQHAAEKHRQQSELAEERRAHDAAIAAERTEHAQRVQQLNKILRTALEGHGKRAPVIARQLAVINEALR